MSTKSDSILELRRRAKNMADRVGLVPGDDMEKCFLKLLIFLEQEEANRANRANREYEERMGPYL